MKLKISFQNGVIIEIEINELTLSENEFRRYLYGSAIKKEECMKEIRCRHIFRLETLSRGVLMILERNDRDFLNSMRRTYGMFSAWPFDKKTKKQHDLIESKDPSDCVVCLEMCGKNNSYKLTCACMYSCHKKCLEKWLNTNNSCPFCKI